MRFLAMILSTLVIGGCAMTGSSLIPQYNGDRPYGIGCRSDSGAYYLSKSFFQIRINRYEYNDEDKTRYELAFLTPSRKPDRREGYCLDYLSSPTSEEKVMVKLTDNYLLKYISTESIDQSGYILKAGIRSVFRAVAGLAGGLRTGEKSKPVTAFEAEYDPFDRIESARINNALRELGFCVVVERQTFDLDRMTVNKYCNDPFRAVRQERAARNHNMSPPPPRDFASRGILYRPRVPYKVYLFIRKNPDNPRSGWNLSQVGSVLMENASPVINVGIDRAFFAARKTTLVFDEGQLGNVCVHKTSELKEISTIPLELAKSIAALPTQIIQLRIDNTNNFAALAQTETQLIKAQQAHIQKLESHTVTPGALPTPGGNNNKKTSFDTQATKDSFGFGAIKDEKLINPYRGEKNKINAKFTSICPQTSPVATSLKSLKTDAAIINPSGTVTFE